VLGLPRTVATQDMSSVGRQRNCGDNRWKLARYYVLIVNFNAKEKCVFYMKYHLIPTPEERLSLARTDRGLRQLQSLADGKALKCQFKQYTRLRRAVFEVAVQRRVGPVAAGALRAIAFEADKRE
jgi:hypothetical protein